MSTAIAPQPTAEQRAAMSAAFIAGTKIGRKWEANDVTASSTPFQAAMAFAQTYTGSFEYMVEMRSAASIGFLTASQAKGVLNCLMAEGRRRQSQRPAAPPQSSKPSQLPTTPRLPMATTRWCST